MPTINTKEWHKMPLSFSNSLYLLMEKGTKHCQWLNPTAFQDEDRTHISTGVFNTQLGFARPSVESRFEFFHVVLTHNTKLNKLIDIGNGHRPRYNHCVMHSFYVLIESVTYRVSIIITIWYTIGAVMDQIRSVASTPVLSFWGKHREGDGQGQSWKGYLSVIQRLLSLQDFAEKSQISVCNVGGRSRPASSCTC